MVFERFDTDIRQFLKMSPLKVAGMRHVLRFVLAALAFELGMVHADLKTANMLLRGAGAFKTVGADCSGKLWGCSKAAGLAGLLQQAVASA